MTNIELEIQYINAVRNDLNRFMDNNRKFLLPIFLWIEKAQKEQRDSDLDFFNYWVTINIREAQNQILGKKRKLQRRRSAKGLKKE